MYIEEKGLRFHFKNIYFLEASKYIGAIYYFYTHARKVEQDVVRISELHSLLNIVCAMKYIYSTVVYLPSFGCSSSHHAERRFTW